MMLNLWNHFYNKVKSNRNFLIFIMIFLGMRWSIADHYRVPSGSMLPTIHIGDHLYVDKMAYDFKLPFTDYVLKETGVPQRGDIVVFKFPLDPSINYVKRLIAIPGDVVEIQNGLVKVNGRFTLEFPEDSLRILNDLENENAQFTYQEIIENKEFTVQRLPEFNREQKTKFVVPQGKYFFMGDNRDNSYDSRSWGFVPRSYLKGKVKNVSISIDFQEIIPVIDLKRFGKTLI